MFALGAEYEAVRRRAIHGSRGQRRAHDHVDAGDLVGAGRRRAPPRASPATTATRCGAPPAMTPRDDRTRDTLPASEVITNGLRHPGVIALVGLLGPTSRAAPTVVPAGSCWARSSPGSPSAARLAGPARRQRHVHVPRQHRLRAGHVRRRIARAGPGSEPARRRGSAYCAPSASASSPPCGPRPAAAFDTGHAALYAVLMASSSAALILPIVDSLHLGGPQVLRLLPQVAIDGHGVHRRATPRDRPEARGTGGRSAP